MLSILGMHRSGTSALARVINLLGAQLGQDLLAAAPDNPKGFWEHRGLWVVHERIFDRLGTWYDDIIALPENWWLDETLADDRREILEILQREFAGHALAAFKDPRACRLWPLWDQLLKQLGWGAKVVLMARHPLEIAGSLNRRDGMPINQALAVCLLHLLDAERFTRDTPRCFVTYDQVLTDWRSMARRMGGQLQIEWPVSIDAAGSAVDEFLDPGLRHHRAAERPLSGADESLVELVMAAHQGYELAAADQCPDLQARLDQVQEATNRQMDRWRGWRPTRPFGRRITQLERLHELDQVLAGQQARELEKQQRENAQRSQQCAQLHSELHTQRQEAERLSQGLEETRIRAGAWEAAAAAGLALPNPDGLVAVLDVPAGAALMAGPVQLRGWCWHFQTPLSQLRLKVNGVEVETRHGQPRDDVAKAYGGWQQARFSGFCAALELPPGVHQWELQGILQDGRQVRWRGAAPLHVVKQPLALRAAHLWQISRHFTGEAAVQVRRQIRRDGFFATAAAMPGLARRGWLYFQALRRGDQPQHSAAAIDPYEAWLAVNPWTEAAAENVGKRLAQYGARLPKISVVMPVYNTPAKWLDRAIASVARQVYQNWELCIADDGSTDAATAQLLQQWQRREPRVRVRRREKNGNISVATNSAAEMAEGQYLCFLDHDDELAPDALAEAAMYLADRPDVNYLYTDDDKIDESGKRFSPQFKAAFSPELLLSYMYPCHMVVIRRDLYQSLGGMRVGFEGAQDYDLALRATERAKQVGHLPLVLYHWRALAQSTASSGGAKPHAYEAGRRAVAEALERRGSRGATVYRPDWATQAHLGIFTHDFPDSGPSVSILIPTRNRGKLLAQCIQSLRQTRYDNYQIIVLDDGSDEPATVEYLSTLSCRVERLGDGKRFHFARLNNQGAALCDSDYLLLLNNDTQVIDPKWLSRMMGYARLPQVGAVGARLLYPDGRVQHAGIVHGLHDGLAGHAFKLLDGASGGYLSQAKVARNAAAVTAACLLTPRKLYKQLGGLDETQFAVAYNDVDYCYRLAEAGYRCVMAGNVELIHHEGATRGFDDDPGETARFAGRWRDKTDTYYNPNLSLENEQYALAPTRLARQAHQGGNLFLFSNALDLTGAPLIQFELATRLRAQWGFTPTVFSVSDGPLRQRYERLGARVIVQNHPLAEVMSGQHNYDHAIKALAELLIKHEAQFVLANTLNSFFGVEAAHRAKIGCLWNIHESEGCGPFFDPLGPAIRGRALECFARPYRVIFGSRATQSVYQPLQTHHNFTTLRNLIETEPLPLQQSQCTRAQARSALGIGEDEKMLLLLGTVCARKGQLDLSAALARLPARCQNQTRAFIVGDRQGDYSRQFHQAVAHLPKAVRDRVTIVAETSDTGRYYQAADIFVCTSRMECFPRVVLEAMHYDLPVVATGVYGIAEQIIADKSGLFYAPGDAAQLAAQLLKLWDNAPLCELLRQNARWMLLRLGDNQHVAQSYARLLHQAWSVGQ